MKKLFVLMMIGSLLVGCTSANDQNDKKSAKPAGSAVALKDNDTKSKDNQKEKDDSEKEEKKQQEEEKQQKQSNAPKESSKNDGTSSKTEKKDNNQSNSNKNESNQENNTPSQDSNHTGETSKPVTPPVENPEPEPPVIQQAKADQVFAQINAYRTQNGKEPFTYSSELRSRCDSHAFAMAQKEALWHSGDGAECITNYDDPFSAWVSSPPHNKLLLSNNTEAAVGIYYYNGYYYSVFQTRW